MNLEIKHVHCILNIKNFKNGENDPWQNVDVKMSYAIEILDNDRLVMNRYKRDLSGMGYGIIYFDPSIQNSYTRIKDGTKEEILPSLLNASTCSVLSKGAK